MGSVDWGSLGRQYGAPTAQGPVDWGGIGGASTIKVAKSAGGSPSGGSGGGGLLGLLENLGSDVGSVITNAPRGFERLGGEVAHTFGPSGVTQNVGWAPLDALLSPLENRHPPKQTFLSDKAGLGGGAVVPFAKQERHIYGEALRGNFHPLYQHPLQPVLDAATVLTGGGALAAKAAEAGRLGDTAAQIARTDRVLTSESGGLSQTLNKSRTLQGRALQQRFDRFSAEHPDTPVVGLNPRLAKISEIRKYRQTIRAGMPAREFQQATSGLTKDEKFAFHVGVEGVPLQDRIGFYRNEFANHPTPQLRDYLHRLESPGVAKAIANPSDKLVAALHEGHGLQETATQRLIDAGQLTRETHNARSIMPQEIMRPGEPIPVNGNLVHPDFPPAFRFPHTGDEAAKPALFTSPSGAAALREQRTPGFLRHSEAVRLRTARLMTNPEVLTRDYLATMRHEHLNEYRAKVMRPVSQDLSHDLERTGFKKPDESYFMEKASQRVPRTVTQREAMSQDLAMTDAKGAETSLGATAKETVFTAADAPAEVKAAIQSGDLAKLQEMGVRRVPAAFAKRYQANFASTGKMMRLFWDKPLDVWRMLTLNLRPAWMVNNVVGNAAQYALRYAGPDGMAAYLQALLHTERGEDKVRQIANWTFKHPTLQRKIGRIINDVAPEVHGTGLYSTHVKMTHGGVYQGTLDKLESTKVAHALSLPTRVIRTGLTAIPRGITAFERHVAEAVPREAAFMMEMKPVIEKLGLAHLSFEEAMKKIAAGENGQREIELAIDRSNDYMGDFNAMNATERRVIKRVIPFESWYRVILQVSGKYALHYPGRVNLISNIGKSYQQDNQSLPSWLKGALEIGGVSKKGNQTMLTTQGLNPYQTLTQIATQNPFGIAAPQIAAMFPAATGVDPFTQGAYHGIGASKGDGPAAVSKRYFGSFIEGLAPTRLAEQTVGTPTSTLYAPHTYGHLGPVKLNDYLLSYLGLPIRHVNRRAAKAYADEGR